MLSGENNNNNVGTTLWLRDQSSNQLNPFEKQNNSFSGSIDDDDDGDDAKRCDLLNNAALLPHPLAHCEDGKRFDEVVIQLTSTNQYFNIKLLYVYCHSKRRAQRGLTMTQRTRVCYNN